MSSPDPLAHNLIGRGVRNLDSAIWDRVQEDVFFTGTLIAKFSQNPAIKQRILSTGIKRLAEASHREAAWGIACRPTG